MNNFLNLKNFRIKVIIAFVAFATILFMIDWLLKQHLFDPQHVDWENNGAYFQGTEKDYELFGIRSVAHNNSTVFSALSLKIPDWAHYIINFSIAAIFIGIPFFTKNLFLGIICGIILSGILGNSIDKAFSSYTPYYVRFGDNSYVRDIFYIPWFDRGTFNFADVTIVTGSLLLIIYVIFTNIRDLVNSKNDEEKELDQEQIVKETNIKKPLPRDPF